MTRAARAGMFALAAILAAAGCDRWYKRGAITVGGSVAAGYGVGSLVGCPVDDTGPCDAPTTGAIVGLAAGIPAWLVIELIIWRFRHSRDYWSGESVATPDYGGGGEDYGPPPPDYVPPTDNSPQTVTIGPSSPGTPEPWPAQDADHVRVTARSAQKHHWGGPPQAELCYSAKQGTDLDMSAQCPTGFLLTHYIIHAKTCSCIVAPGSSSCEVEVEGLCTRGSKQATSFGIAAGPDLAFAQAMAQSNAATFCGTMTPGSISESTGLFACDTYTIDNGAGPQPQWVCSAFARCRL